MYLENIVEQGIKSREKFMSTQIDVHNEILEWSKNRDKVYADFAKAWDIDSMTLADKQQAFFNYVIERNNV